MADSSELDKKRGTRRSRWIVRPLWVCIVVLSVLGGLSVPPLARLAAQKILIAGASVFGLRVHATVHVDFFSQLRLTDIRLTPRSVSHRFFRAAELKELTVDYDLRRLRDGGIWRVVTAIKAKGGQFHLRHAAKPSQTAPTSSTGSRIDAALRSALGMPGRLSADIDLQDISVDVEGALPLTSLSDLTLELRGGHPGNLKIGKVTLASGIQLGPIVCPVTSDQEQLTLGPLKLTPELEISALSIGAANSTGKKSAAILLEASGGTLRISLAEQGSDWHGIISGKNFAFAPLLKTLKINPQSIPSCRSVEVEAVGTPLDARSWKGTASIQLSHQTPKGGQIISELDAAISSGELSILAGRIFSESTNLIFNGSIRNDAAQISAATIGGSASIDGTFEDLSEWFPQIENRLRGNAQISLHAELQGGTLTLRPRIVGSRIDASQGTHWLRSKALSTEGELQFPIKELFERGIQETIASGTRSGSARFATLTMTAAETKIGGTDFQISTDAAHCSVAISDGIVNVSSLLLISGSNQVSGGIKFRVPKAATSITETMSADLEARCPLIQGEIVQIAGHIFTGSIQATLKAQVETGRLDGNIQMMGSNMRWGRCGIPLVRIRAAGNGGNVVIDEFYTSLGDEQAVQLSGSAEITPPFAYNLSAQVSFPKIDRIQAFISQAGIEGPTSGQIEGSWSGAGVLTGLSGSGECKLRGRDLRWKNLEVHSADFAASYEPGKLQIQRMQLASRDTRFSAEAAWANNTLALSKMNLQQKGRDVLDGELNMPLTWDAAGIHWVKDGRISGVMSASNIELGPVFQGLDGQSPVTGSATFSLNLSGTPDTPLVEFIGRGKSMKSRHYPRLAGCDFDLQAKHENRMLRCEILMHSPLGAPLRLDAQASFTFEDLFAGNINWIELPVRGSIRIDQAKLQVLPTLFHQLRDVKGTGSIQARMQGSLGNPILEGALKLDCEALHFQTDRIPAITDLHASVRLDREHLHIERIRADLGGGSLAISGIASFLEPRNPSLSIDIKAHQVLVQRTQQLSLRLDGDLRVEGRWDAAAVRGKLYAVKSMVRRDIELLPISAMQSGGSGYKRPPGKPWFIFPRKPFSDWKLDVQLATRQGDPVLIRGNRLRGTAKVDLRLLGTGAAPTLDGSYISDDVIALLPFARVEVSRGRVWYAAGAPFLPQTEFTAESEIRNHRIRMYLHGPPENPQISVSSDPPLAERDALTLLTAGVLPGDFASESSQAASSRAAALLMQEFSDKVLQKDGGSERFTALRRFSLDVGALNSRTGNQETRLTYRLQDNLFVIGEIGANGDFATRLRYAFRFY